MECEKREVPAYKWDYPTRLEYEYPKIDLNIGQGFVHPENEHTDPWLVEHSFR